MRPAGIGNAVEWLGLWERAAPWPPRRRRWEMLVAAGARDGLHPPEHLRVGEANARLLKLYVSMFGSRVGCGTACPQCSQALEMDIDADELLKQMPVSPAGFSRLQVEDWEISFQLPTEADIDTALGMRDEAAAKGALLQRCVRECRRGAEAVEVSMLPPEVTLRLLAGMEEADPLATLDFELRCEACGHGWSSALQVDSVLWARLDVWARRLLQEVHALASAYGWNEWDIVKMSPGKRQIYLDLVQG